MYSQEAKIYIPFLIATIVLLFFLFFYVISIIRYNRKKQQLMTEELQAEIVSQEMDRQRISADLHDDLGPILSGIKMQLNALELTEAQDKKIIEKVDIQLNQAINRIRSLSHELTPDITRSKSLIKVLEETCADLHSTGKVSVEFHYDPDIRFEPDQQIHVYRICMEIINNSLKHANATAIRMRFTQKDREIRIDIADNGKGLPKNFDAENSRGLGLRNITARVEFLKGSMKFVSRPLQGLQFSISIPQLNDSY